MIDGIISLIGRNAKPLTAFLVGLIIANVCFQFYTHKTTALTPWKGGGFGMYTETHVDNRTVWLEFEGANGTTQLRIYPENEGIRTWVEGVSLKGGTVLQSITNQAAGLRYYPGSKDADALIASASRIGWLQELTSDVTPKDGKTFKSDDIRVLIYENIQDMQAGVLKRRIVFATSAGGV